MKLLHIEIALLFTLGFNFVFWHKLTCNVLMLGEWLQLYIFMRQDSPIATWEWRVPMLIVRCKDGLFVVRWDLNGSALMAHQWYVSYTRALFFKPKFSVHPSTGHLIGQEFRLPKQQRHGMGTISAEKLYGRTKTELHTCGTIVRRTKGAKSTAQYAIAQAHLFRTLWG